VSKIREHININTDLTQVVGDKNYEFTNLPTTFGIGNVLQVVTDRKLAQDNGIYDLDNLYCILPQQKTELLTILLLMW
jgi:hypothetical protein